MEIRSIMTTAVIAAASSAGTYFLMDSRQVATAAPPAQAAAPSPAPVMMSSQPEKPPAPVEAPVDPCISVPRPDGGPNSGLVGKHFESFTGTHYQKVPYSVTVTSVLDAAEASRKQLITPGACNKANSQGFAMIVIGVEISNPVATSWHCPGADFVLIAADGRKAEPLQAPRAYDFCGDMDPGAKAKFPLIFRVPKDFNAVQLQKTSTFFTGKLSLL